MRYYPPVAPPRHTPRGCTLHNTSNHVTRLTKHTRCARPWQDLVEACPRHTDAHDIQCRQLHVHSHTIVLIDPSGAAKGEGLKAVAPWKGARESPSVCVRRRVRDEEIPNELCNRQRGGRPYALIRCWGKSGTTPVGEHSSSRSSSCSPSRS